MAQEQSVLHAGPALRAARKSLGLEITEIATELCISRRYLEAMEAEALDELPSEAYALGFLRSYAALLGLDPQPQIDAFRQLMAPSDEGVDLGPAAVDSPSRNPARWVLALAVVGSLIVYLGWSYFGQQAIPVEDASVRSDEGTASADKVSLEAKASEAIKPEKGDPVVHVPTPTPANNAPERVLEVVELPVEANVQPAMDVALRLVARRDTWLRLGDGANKLVFEGVLVAGDERILGDDTELYLTTGDAGGLDLYARERLLAPLGEAGEVIRDRRLGGVVATGSGGASE